MYNKNKISYINIFLFIAILIFAVDTFSVRGHSLIQKAMASIATITGQGSISYLPKFTIAGTPNQIGDSSIYDAAAGGPAGEKVRIDVSGNVGIGTQTPSEKLEVSSSDGIKWTDGVEPWRLGRYSDNASRTGWAYLTKGTGTGYQNLAVGNIYTSNDAYIGALGGYVSSTVCRSDGTNCLASGTVSGSGNANYIPMFTGATTLANSQITWNGSYYTVNSGGFYVPNSWVIGDLLMSRSGNIHLGGADKLAMSGYDAFLRLNQTGQFTSGVFTPGTFRADGDIFQGGAADGNRVCRKDGTNCPAAGGGPEVDTLQSVTTRGATTNTNIAATQFLDSQNPNNYYVDPNADSFLGNVEVTSQLRVSGTEPSGIFARKYYDYDNLAGGAPYPYYLDPAGGSVLNSASFNTITEGGFRPCLSSGTNCPPVVPDTDTLHTVTTRGNTTINSITVGDIYNNSWFRNNDAGEGLYNQATGGQLASQDSNFWYLKSGLGLRFYDNSFGISGYVYHDATGFGMLNNQGNWMFYAPTNSTSVQFPGGIGVGGPVSMFGTWKDYSAYYCGFIYNVDDGGFCNWDGTEYYNRYPHQATTDGFVVVTTTAVCCGIQSSMHGFSDNNPVPNTYRGMMTLDTTGSGTGTAIGSFMFPVRKGDYWSINAEDQNWVISGGLYFVAKVYWIPFGTTL
ncbi:MAG: hypothetical protein WAX85_00230 [Minisyncoccia bacterium]